MYKKILLIIGVIYLPFNISAQFNTIIQKKAITTRIIENKKAKKDTSEIATTDIKIKQQKKNWNRRLYVSLPIDSITITSPYGMRKHPITKKNKFHNGVDLKAHNDYIYSIMPGEIIKTGTNKKAGKYIKIRHGDYETCYCHLYSILVNAKQSVTAGQPIGISGNTGRSTGEHLHLGIKYKGKYINPVPILNEISKLLSTIKNEISEEIKQIKKQSESN